LVSQLRKEHRLRGFDNRVCSKIFAPKRDEVTGEWSRIHYERLYPHHITFR